MDKQKTRSEAWEELRKVARPDSRFHFDFSSFIPDFEGSEKALDKLVDLEIYKNASLLFVTPDECLVNLRAYCIQDGKTIIVSPYGIRRPLVILGRKDVPEGHELFAACLDGLERFSHYITLDEIGRLGKLDLMVTGGSAVNLEGIRFGKGHGYFDLEWAMMREIGVVNEDTPVVIFVHDCQVIDESIEPDPFDSVADIIVTPTRTIMVEKRYPKPAGIIWEKLDPHLIEEIPPLQELRERRCL